MARAGPGSWLSGPGHVGEVLSVAIPGSAKAFLCPQNSQPCTAVSGEPGWQGREGP